MGLEGPSGDTPIEKPKPKGNTVTVRISGSNSNLTVAGGSQGGNEVSADVSGHTVNAEVNGIKLTPDIDGVIRHEDKTSGSKVFVSGGDVVGQTINLRQEKPNNESSVRPPTETSSILDTSELFTDAETPDWINDGSKLQALFTIFNRLSRGTWKADQLPKLLEERGFEPGSWTAPQLKAIYDKNAEVMEWKPWTEVGKLSQEALDTLEHGLEDVLAILQNKGESEDAKKRRELREKLYKQPKF